MTIRRLALVQLSVGVLLGLAYAVLVGPTLVDVWTTDAPVATSIVAFSILAAWLVARVRGCAAWVSGP
jgi:hypothetical protein